MRKKVAVVLITLFSLLLLSTSCLVPNQPPSAVIDVSDSTGRAPFKVSFDAYESEDSDGTIERCSWDFGDGDTDSGMFVTHTFSNPGTYTVILTVWDDDGATDSASVTINVLEGPKLSDFRITSVHWEPSTCYFLLLNWPCVYVYVTVESNSPYPANVVIEATARDATGAFLGSNELFWNNTCDIPPRETFVVDGKIIFVEGPTPNVARVDARIVRVEACN